MDFPRLHKEEKLWGWRNFSKISEKKGITTSKYDVLTQKAVPAHLGSIESDSILHLKTSSFQFLQFTKTER